MAASSKLTITDAERRFPCRIKLGIPITGLGARLTEMHAWLDENCGADGWIMAPAGLRGGVNDAVALYFLDATLAAAFVSRWCAGSKVEISDGAFPEWLTEEPRNAAQIRRADRFLMVARRKALSLRCISIIAFLTFFVVGPILTYWRGLVFALIQIAPVYFSTLLMLLLSSFFDRRFWGRRRAEIVYAVIEAAICPAYLANITHRFSWKCIRLDVDGASYGLMRCSPHFLDEFRAGISFALEELDRTSADDPIEQARIHAYNKRVLG